MGSKWTGLGVGVRFDNCLGSTHVVEQLSFFMFPSTLAFDFDLLLGSFLTFGALIGYFWGCGRVQKLFWRLLI